MAKRRRKLVKNVVSELLSELPSDDDERAMVVGPHGPVPAPAPGTPLRVQVTPPGEDQLPAGPHGHIVHVEFVYPEDAAELMEHLSKLPAKVKATLRHNDGRTAKAKAKKTKAKAKAKKKIFTGALGMYNNVILREKTKAKAKAKKTKAKRAAPRRKK